jgi:hypothetical protein
MCKGDGCELKNNCYRYLATPSYYQSFFASPPVKNGSCDHYWEMTSVKKKDWEGLFKEWMKNETSYTASSLMKFLSDNYIVPEKI